MHLTLEKILISIDKTNAVLKQIKADYKADIEAIRNAQNHAKVGPTQARDQPVAGQFLCLPCRPKV
jgi:hypothetical protein